MGKGLIILVAAASLSGALLMNSIKRTEFDTDVRNSQYEEGVLAREIARSALNKGIARASAAFETIGPNQNELEAPYQGGYYDLTYRRLGSKVEVTAVGRHGGQQHRISTTLTLLPSINAALIVQTPDASATFGGNTFLIDGNDARPPSMAAQSYLPDPAYGILTNLEDVAYNIGSALKNPDNTDRCDRVIGVNGTCSVFSGKVLGDLDALYQEAKEPGVADRTLGGGTFAGNASYGSAASPEIVVITGDATISGTIRGFGMLVVEGNLTVTGTLEWEGIVMVKKETSMSVDYGGTATIYGSLVLLQGSSAFTMPATGKVRVTYKYSDAGYQSAVYIHPYGDAPEQLFAKGSNRNGDQMAVQERIYPKGKQMNFFIRTWASSGNPNVYDHYARGQNAPNGTPYARVSVVGKNKWLVEFEDLNVQSGHTPDWDYNDQVIEVEVIPTEEDEQVDEPFDVWWTDAGLPGALPGDAPGVDVRADDDTWANLASWLGERLARRDAPVAAFAARAYAAPALSAGILPATLLAVGSAAYAAPGKPSLSSPSNNKTNVATSTRLDWGSVSGADYYLIQVSTKSNFSSTVVYEAPTSSQYDVGGLSNGVKYYWRVRACADKWWGSDDCGDWSSTWNFTTVGITAPGVPTLVAPVSGTSNVSTSPQLSWISSSGATSYTIQVSKSSSFASGVEEKTTSASSYALSGLNYATTYYWRVRACNSAGCSSYTSSRSFTTEAAPPPPPTDDWATCTADLTGSKLCLRVRGNARVFYSKGAIERLKPLLSNLADYRRVAVDDQWVESSLVSAP